MGIFCEINLSKASNEFYQPGQSVSGIIRYAVDKDTDIEKITTSLKGKGNLCMEVSSGTIVEDYKAKETYVNVEDIVQDVKCTIPVGSYEIKFNFIMPTNIPSTTVIKRNSASVDISGKIKYFISIHFETSGFLTSNKKFKKEIIVLSKGKETLLREPVIYGETKKLSIFNSKNTIRLKSTIFDSVIPIGGKIIANCEVENKSNVLIKSVEIKLVEKYDFNAKGHREHRKKTVPDADFIKTTSIKCGETETFPIELTVPCDIHSLDHSNMISRNYALKIKATLPIPYKNIVLFVPVQIGSVNLDIDVFKSEQLDPDLNYDEPPPTYCEAMEEEKNSDDDINKDTKEK